MAGPIYLMYIGKAKEAWYQLSPAEQNELIAKLGAAVEQVGGKAVIRCDASWSTGPWQIFGVEEYPDIEAVQKHAKLEDELNWKRYIESLEVLGTEWE